ncbi:MAG: hypothetical protein MZW92_19425 [Comamonadaceae bacterium]|nr:hypothetical protein [Comamonadaceae bacterium]
MRDALLLKDGLLDGRRTPDDEPAHRPRRRAARQRDPASGVDAGPMLRYARQIARHHHECWDGSGYLDGLAGEAIPPAARLMAVADVYDALISERPYKRAWPHAEAVAFVRGGAGRQFDPLAVEALLACEGHFVEIAARLQDAGGASGRPGAGTREPDASISIRSTLLAVASALRRSASALDLDWSGFGTIGWAQSNRDYVYERSVDSGGPPTATACSSCSWTRGCRRSGRRRCSSRPRRRWAATTPGSSTPTWAFAGWRPSDDWLLRVVAPALAAVPVLRADRRRRDPRHGARCPPRCDAIAPSNEIDGGSATKTWMLGDGELSLDAYAGSATTTARYVSRDGAPAAAPRRRELRRGQGAAVGPATDAAPARCGVARQPAPRAHQADRRLPASWWRRSASALAPGDAYCYYKVDDSMPGGGPVRTVSTITNYIFTLGLEQHLGGDWRVAAEYARDLQRDTELASNTSAAAVALSREIGPVTP